MRTLITGLLLGGLLFGSTAAFSQSAGRESAHDGKAEALLNAAAAKLKRMHSLKVEGFVSPGAGEQVPFRRQYLITLERPNRFRYEDVSKHDRRQVVSLSDGQRVWSLDRQNYIAYQQPFHAENFYSGVTPLVQFFFKPVLGFDPTDPFWGNSVSLFDVNKSAYDKYVTTRYEGEKTVEGMTMQLVRVRYTSRTQQMEQLFYLRDDWIMIIIATPADGRTVTTKYRNYQENPALAPSSFAYAAPKQFPVQQSDPVRLGQPAPDFELPLEKGGTLKLKELLKGKRGLLVTTLDGTRGMGDQGPDAYLAQMRVMQAVRDKYASQGLEVVALVGGKYVTPDVTTEMMRNWMPDTSRFSYPIAIDVDLERGIQGSAYQNFHLGGRDNVLLDHEGRVVFACTDFDSKRANELALYQALAQIGFSVSAADLDGLIVR